MGIMNKPIDLLAAAENHIGLRHQNSAWRYLQANVPTPVLKEFAMLYRNEQNKPQDQFSVPHVGHCSHNGIELIKKWEGCRLSSYRCSSDVLTIGYGHTGPDVQESQTITQSKADQLLAQDLVRFENAIDQQITAALTQAQFDALVSWCFNVGEGATADSTLRKRLNAGEDQATVIREELPRWNKGPSGPVEGLTNRRADEVRYSECAD